MLGLQVYAQQSLTLHVGTGDLNPSIHAYTANILTRLNSPQQLALPYFLYLGQVEIILAVKNLRGLLKIPALEQTCPLPQIIVVKKITWTLERDFENLLLLINS